VGVAVERADGDGDGEAVGVVSGTLVTETFLPLKMK